jgi:hypothetical protein
MALHGRAYLSGWRGKGCHHGRWVIYVSHDGDCITAILGGQIHCVPATYGGNGLNTLLLETQPGLDVGHPMRDHHLRHSNSSHQGVGLDATPQSLYSLSGVNRAWQERR